MTLNLHLLRIFYTVVEKQSFSLAAKTLFISQPAVSKAVKELEHLLSFNLIERGQSRNQIILTQLGQRLFEHARGIFALEKAALEEIDAICAVNTGKLTIGASTTVAAYCLAELIKQFNQISPSVQICLKVGNTQQVTNWLIDCELDIAFVEGEVNDPRLKLEPWQTDELIIVAPINFNQHAEQSFEQLKQANWIMREKGSGTREWNTQILAQLNLLPQHIIEMGSSESIIQAVRSGLGVAILPKVVAKDGLTLGEIVQIELSPSEHFYRPLYQLKHLDRPLSPAATAFEELAQKTTL
ncbi:LysR family transcriptional regulator [Catenovulum sp. 2E275]|uniref:LysR family transcriptional regulator n=1 Tax=Catenovulum sp. 2E275 TaxID=2980497 RepID=UPI0021D3CF01|nr:LysR family transcriptional regulator [Catenovulum sp. 2E275]MCU4674659.1 LysR family transcriptional regulator [Catenovulum sp. 2E275]